jgi:hypothetical protein
MTKNGEATTVFDAKRHLTSCFKLPTRDPEPFYNPTRKKTLVYGHESGVLVKHEKELNELQREGVPFYTARALVLTTYADTYPELAKRVAEAQRP